MPKHTVTQSLGSPPLYDQQASHYDQRVGLSDPDCQKIAETVLLLSQLQAHELLVDVGAGTGQIGHWFTQNPGQYLGFDLSAGMLSQFQARLGASDSQWQLVQADGNQRWPVADGAARVIFSSRAIHLLNCEHVCRECYRLTASNGTFVLFGRVQRFGNSLQAQMKKKMQHLLQVNGFQPRQGARQQQHLLDVLVGRGGQSLTPVTVSRWLVTDQPQKSLQAWRQKAGLAGNDLPNALKAEILAALEAWAIDQFGDLQATVESEEAYVLQGVLLHPQTSQHKQITAVTEQIE